MKAAYAFVRIAEKLTDLFFPVGRVKLPIFIYIFKRGSGLAFCKC